MASRRRTTRCGGRHGLPRRPTRPTATSALPRHLTPAAAAAPWSPMPQSPATIVAVLMTDAVTFAAIVTATVAAIAAVTSTP
eukprot:2590019-Pleurochrysis_carterae.AAC.1